MEPRKYKPFLQTALCLIFILGICHNTIAQFPIPLASTYNSVDQRLVAVHFNQNITIAPDNFGWTIEVNSFPVTILTPNPIGVGSPTLEFLITTPIAFGDVVTVSYDDSSGMVEGVGGPLASFMDLPSQNTNIPDCSMFTGMYSINVNSLSGQCSPVDIDITISYEIAPHFRNSINFNPADLRFSVSWGDAEATVNNFSVIETSPGSGIFEATDMYFYPANDPECSYDLVVTPVYNNPVLTCVAHDVNLKLASYELDNVGGNLYIATASLPEFCLGEDIVGLTFEDQTEFSCHSGVEPTIPDHGQRHAKFVYSTKAGRQIPNVFIDVSGTMVQVTDAGGNGIIQMWTVDPVTGGAVAPYSTKSGYFEGPVFQYDSTTSPFPNMVSYPIHHTGDTVNDLPGDQFEIMLQMWGPCNPWDTAEINPPVTATEFITLLDIPPPPTAPDQDYCIGSIDSLTAMDNTGGQLNWFDDAGLISLVHIGPTFDHGQTTVGTYDYWVAESDMVSGCLGPATHVLLTINEAPVITIQPVNIKTTKPGIIQMVAETGGAAHTKSWLRSADGGNTWATLTDGSKYSGTTTDTLTLINPYPGKDILYRMKLTTALGCEVYSVDVPVGIDFHYQVDKTTIHLTGMAPEYQYLWSFGDGEFSNQSAPAYTYAVPGIYEVCLTAFDNIKDFSEEICKPIQVGTVDCQAQFDYSISGTDSLTVFIADASSGAVNSWYWTFGDGTVSEKKDPAHIYGYPGLYKVCLTTMDTISGCQSHVCQNIEIGKEPMIADFIHITNDTNKTVLFSNQSAGDITHWYWTFGDGESFIGKETSHTYDRAGLYEVCLFTNNSVTGEFAESCKKIRVGATPCNIKAEFISFISNKNLRVAFNDRSTGNIAKWFWNFGDGISSTLRNPVHIYERNGLYEVGLSIRDSLSNCYDYYTELIQVGEIACKADFEYNVDPATRIVNFKNRSSKNSEISFWSFGDGEFGEDRDPEHTYPDAGVFGVTLTIVDSTGQCMDSKFEKVQVGSVKCQADFTYYIDSAGNKAYFTSHLLGDPTQMVWTFGDGSSSDELNPVHQYAAGGFYKVGLNAFNDENGCMDFQEKIILISTRGEDCLADFIYSSDMTNREVSFTDRSTGNIDNYIWDFGDRNVLEAKDPVHSYGQGGFYLVCLTVQNEFGITNTTCKHIQVAAESSRNCLADYYFSIDSAGTTVSFVDASFGKPDEWTWDFGDDQTSGLGKPVHLYSETGVYRVGLRIRNSSTECVSKVYKLIDAGAKNTGLFASFLYELDSTNLKADSYPVDFIGISLGDSKKFKWDFGDGDTNSTSIQPRHEYTKPSIFDACFSVYNPITGEEDISCEKVSTIPSGIKQIRTNAISLVAYPNPFNDKFIIDYYLPAEDYVDISIYDFTGRKIASVVGMNKAAGNHTVEFDRDRLSSGLYYVVLRTKQDYLINKVVKQ